LKLPRTVVFGEQTLPDPDMEALPTLGVRVAIVARTGHSMAWENPCGVANAIADALSEGC